MITIFQRDNTSTIVIKYYKDRINDSTKHYFAQNKEVYFAIKLEGPNPEKLFDLTYFTFEILQSKYIKENNSEGYSISSTKIEFEKCGDKFLHVEKTVYERVGSTNYICPKTQISL